MVNRQTQLKNMLGVAIAQDSIGNPALGPTLQGMLSGASAGTTFLNTILPNLIGLGFIIGGLYFLYELIMGAIHWMMSAGDKSKLQEARDQLQNAFIGFIILVSTYAVIKLISLVFGIDLLVIDFSTLVL